MVSWDANQVWSFMMGSVLAAAFDYTMLAIDMPLSSKFFFLLCSTFSTVSCKLGARHLTFACSRKKNYASMLLDTEHIPIGIVLTNQLWFPQVKIMPACMPPKTGQNL
jgi:hypothetical protein